MNRPGKARRKRLGNIEGTASGNSKGNCLFDRKSRRKTANSNELNEKGY